MRDIEFRAWDTKDNKWLFGSPEGFSMFGEMVLMGEWGAAAWHSISDDEPDRYVLQQYTGIKDKNGKEIFEGDIIKDSPNNIGYKRIVEYKDHSFALSRLASWLQHEIDWSSIEVIGNIYENPELLEKNN